MADWQAEWKKVQDAAFNVLGPDGGTPEFAGPFNVYDSMTDDVRKELAPAADKISSAVLSLLQSAKSRSELWEELQDRVDASDLGLNPKKNKADAKPVADAKKLLDGFIKKQIADIETEMKQLRDGHKLVVDLKAHVAT